MAGCNLRKGQDWDFNTAWGGGNWRDRIGKLEGAENIWESGGWEGGKWADRTGLGGFSKDVNTAMAEFNESWGGDKWLKDRLGMGQFDKKSGSGADDSVDNPDMPDDPGDESTVDDEVMEELTEGDPNEEAQIAAQRARRRRALMSKFNKQDTIRTSGRGAKQYA